MDVVTKITDTLNNTKKITYIVLLVVVVALITSIVLLITNDEDLTTMDVMILSILGITTLLVLIYFGVIYNFFGVINNLFDTYDFSNLPEKKLTVKPPAVIIKAPVTAAAFGKHKAKTVKTKHCAKCGKK